MLIAIHWIFQIDHLDSCSNKPPFVRLTCFIYNETNISSPILHTNALNWYTISRSSKSWIK